MFDGIIDQINRKDLRILINWRNSRINFGTIDFKPDGSLIYSPTFFNNHRYPFLETGSWNDIYKRKNKENLVKNVKGLHVSLHPELNIVHIRQKNEEDKDQTILRKKINWFPVAKPFIFLRIVSPPLDECAFTKKSRGFNLGQIPDDYVNSIEVLIRVFPRNIDPHSMELYKESIWNIVGYCPNYWVCCDFVLMDGRSAPAILWPKDD